MVEQFIKTICGVRTGVLFLYIKHGLKMHCPMCGAPGRLDLKTDSTPDFENAIWYNTHEKHWECYDCWLK